MAQAGSPEKSRDLLDSDVLILVAEDNRVNQKLAILQLKEMGIAAHTVSNGLQAVEAVKVQDYTLVLMDCQMPEMDGYQATKVIRQHEITTGKHIPIIAMTAQNLEGDREQCLACGMDDFISKPVNSRHLRQILHFWLAKAAPGAIKSGIAKGEDGPAQAASPDTYAQKYSEWEKTFGAEVATALMNEIIGGTDLILSEMAEAIKRRDSCGLAAAVHRLKGIWLALPAGPHCHIEQLQTSVDLDDWTAIEKQHRLLQEDLASFLEKLPKFA